MEIKSAITLILGRNGCGKSRLIATLNILPPNRDDLKVGGEKHVTFTFNSEMFEAYFKQADKTIQCSLKNVSTGEVLHKNTNPSNYNKTVKELFGYTKELHDVLTGNLRFTNMTVAERRKWFGNLSTSDLTYALSFYKKAKEHARDLSGAVKSTSHNISSLRPTVTSCIDELKDTKKRIDELQGEISKLDVEINSANNDDSVTKELQDQRMAYVKRVQDEIDCIGISEGEIKSLANKDVLRDEVIAVNSEYKRSLKMLEEVEEKKDRATKLKAVDVNELCGLLEKYQNAEIKNRGGLVQFQELADVDPVVIESSICQAEQFSDGLIAQLEKLSGVENIPDLKKRYAELQSEGSKLQQNLNIAVNTQNDLVSKLSYLNEVNEVECSQCHYKFKPGVAKGEIDRITLSVSNYAEGIAKLKEDMTDNQERAEITAGRIHAMDEIHRIVQMFKGNAANELLFGRIINNESLANQIHTTIPLINRFKYELNCAKGASEARKMVEGLNRDIKLAEATIVENTEGLNQIYEELEKSIGVAGERLKTINRAIEQIAVTEAKMGKLDELKSIHSNVSDEVDMMQKTIVENERVKELCALRDRYWTILIEAKNRYEEMDRERIKLEMLEKNMADLVERHKAAAGVVKAMSPDHGILAKYLFQSITTITEYMSNCINTVWGYEMQILPCDISDSELSYRFPFWAIDSDNRASDVSKGSKAQKEVIDFVFTLAVYNVLKLDAYPGYLDEISSGFDEYHRAEMVTFIKQLLAGNRHSQVFMVSHDPATHYQMTHADVVVLDPNGVTLPETYNEHVVIM